MRITRRLTVPTGDILIGEGERGPLEFLSLGDYGAHVNLNQGRKVTHGPLLPLTEKWVVTISTQYGCSMGCRFCDVPRVGPGRNASADDLLGQIRAAMQLHPEVTGSERLNVHFARMGEPTWNPAVLVVARELRWLRGFRVHPVVSTMMPRQHRGLARFLAEWVDIKNRHFAGNAGLQLSINSTDEAEREEMFARRALSLDAIADMTCDLVPVGRKFTLNFAVAGYEIDANRLSDLFDPQRWLVKLTPMHRTAAAVGSGIVTPGDYTDPYPYEPDAEELRRAGFDVLVFIASREEDLGRITCGNAILSGALPLVPYEDWAPPPGGISRPGA